MKVGETITVNIPGHSMHGRTGKVIRIRFLPNSDYNYIYVQLDELGGTAFYACHLKRGVVERLADLA